MAITSSWTRRQTITIDHTKVTSGAHSDFPVLIADGNFLADLYTNAKSDGSDLRFTSDASGTTELSFEIVSFTPGSSLSEVWVKIPSLSSSTDTVIYVWYGNSSASAYAATDTYGSRNVWTNGYRAMWHLKTDNDSTSNAYTLSETGSQAFAAAKVGNGKDFQGGRTQNNSIANFGATDEFTVGAWIKSDSITTAQDIHSKQDGSTRNFELAIYSSKVFFSNAVAGADLSGTTTLSTGTWYFIVGIHTTASSGSNRIMLNGSSDNNNTGTGNTGSPSANYTLGANSYNDAGGSPFDGIIDEAFILTRAATQGEITTMYNNQNSPSTFSTGSAGGPVIGGLSSIKSMVGFGM